MNSILDHCPPRERGTFMEYDECPLDVLSRWDVTRGVMVLVLQPPPPNYQPKKQRRVRPSDSQRPLGQIKKVQPKMEYTHSAGDQTPTSISISDGIKARFILTFNLKSQIYGFLFVENICVCYIL